MLVIEKIGTTKAYQVQKIGSVESNLRLGGDGSKFVPNLNISWPCFSGSEKFFLNLNRKDQVITTEQETLDSLNQKISLIDNVFHFGESEKDFKWDIIIPTKPIKNYIDFDLQCSSGIEFYYQDTIYNDWLAGNTIEKDWEECQKTIIRPDNIVGSYAVYCRKKNALKDAKGNYVYNYFSGKLAHFYRPLLIDAKGKKEWGILFIDKSANLLRITIPQVFKNTAEYPITIDPTIGNIAEAATQGICSIILWANRYISDVAGEANPGTFYMYGLSESGGNLSVASAAYEDNAGTASGADKVSSGNVGVITLTTSIGWRTAAITWLNIAASTDYWLAINPENYARIRYDTSSYKDMEYYTRDYDGAMPTPLATSGWTPVAIEGCLYVEYSAAAGGLSILPSGIGSGQVIGTHQVNRYIVTSGIASGQAMGTFSVQRYVTPSGIASGQVFGTNVISRNVKPTGLASGESFGTSKVNRYIVPTGVSTAQSFGMHQINRSITFNGIASGEALGTHQLNRFVIPSGIASAENIGSHIISAGIVYLLPTGIGSSEAFGNAQLKRFILPSGISSNEAIGNHTLRVYILPSGISTAEAIGTHQLNRFVIPSGITSRESIGSHIVFSGAIYLLPSGIISSESFGQSKLNRFILATGIPSGESIGTLSISRWLLPSGIGSREIFGGVSLGRFIVPSGIASLEVFGSHQFNYPLIIYPSGIISAESIGAFIISEVGAQSVLPAGIASAEAFGSLVIPIPFNRDWNELKARIIYLLRNDAILRGLLNKSASPYGIYFIRPPEKPSFPVLTMRFIDEIMDVEKNPQPRTINVEFKAYSATNSDQILERVEELINHSVNFTDMIEYKVSHAALDSIGPDDFDVNFNIYTGSHRYVFFVDHHQLTTWS